VEIKRAIILFADIQGSIEFGFTQPPDKYNEMLRDFHNTAHQAVQDFRKKHELDAQRLLASCKGDECCVFLICDNNAGDELLALELAVYLKEKWKASKFCKLNWQAADTGLIPQVDLRIGIGAGDVVLDHDVWSNNTTIEGIMISEAKRIEGMADQAKETLIMVKWDIWNACIKTGAGVEFGDVMRLSGNGIPQYYDIKLYPVKSYAGWQKIQTEVVPSPTTVMEQLNRALALHRSGELKRAIEEYTAVLKRDEKLASAWMLRGEAYFNSRCGNEALADFNHSLKLRPDDPDALYKRGVTYEFLARYEEALADYKHSLELRPDDPLTLNNRGNTYAHMKRYEQALADHNRSLELRPDAPLLLNNRGCVYLKTKRYGEALSDFNRSLELMPDNPVTFYNVACLFSLQNKADDALIYLEKAIKGDDKYQQMARDDKDFDKIRSDPHFKKLIETS